MTRTAGPSGTAWSTTRPTGCGGTRSARRGRRRAGHHQDLREGPRRAARLYQTDVLTKKAVDFIDRRGPRRAPVLPVGRLPRAAPRVGPHAGDHRAARARGSPPPRVYASRPLPKPASFNEDDMSDKPSFVARFNRRINAEREAAITKRFHERWESLLAVDEGVERIIEELRRHGELDNTYVIFTSDHGFMQGEHRIPQGKMVPYDPSTQVPLLIRGPGLPRGRSTKALVGDVDLAPTIMDATPADAGHQLDGQSILPFARTRAGRRSSVPPHDRRAGREGPHQYARGGRPRRAAAGPGLERRAHDALVVHRISRGIPRALQREDRPAAAEVSGRRPAPPPGCPHAAPSPGRPTPVPGPVVRQVRLGLGPLSGEGGIRTLDGGFPPYSLSRRVPSATRPPLPRGSMLEQPALQAQ